ncbi:AzlC family ABC transporter permease [Helicobacter burdigaliensis]|uniref:AzlC family ABC transporter permease n=1 Tax=Helicobacter burdigaliensis TaxID=2315334 RepID=UPI000EF6C825|nr:AzlC family ABC transporter permease [Helicobacter burdigaliensis]
MFFKSFLQTLPVCIGYLSLGATFGILFATDLNLSWFYALLMALFVYAGAGQLLLVSLIALKAGFFQIAIASFFLNIRHIFYSLSILDTIKSFSLSKYYILFGLTDETFAILKTNKESHTLTQKELEKSYLFITLFNHFYWIVGCMLGVFIGKNLNFKPQGIEFTLTALFSVLTLSLLYQQKSKIPFYAGILIGVFGLLFFPSKYFLILSILLGIIFLLLAKRWISYE